MDKQSIVTFVLGVIPALWAAAGPALTVMVTGFFNSAVKAHVPRELQIPLAGLLSAAATALAGGDAAMMGTSAAIGSTIQSAFSTNPDTVLAGPKPTAPDAKPATS